MINTDEICRQMQFRHITYGSIALYLGITEREVRSIVNGDCVPSWDHLVKIAIKLGCNVFDLIVKENANA